MNEYKVKAVQRMDEWSGQWGPMVTYNVSLEGEEGWIRLNQKLDTPAPRENDILTGQITFETFRDGDKYRKFTKVNPQYEGKPQQQSQASSQESYIVKMLEELTGRRPAYEGDSTPTDAELEDPFKGL